MTGSITHPPPLDVATVRECLKEHVSRLCGELAAAEDGLSTLLRGLPRDAANEDAVLADRHVKMSMMLADNLLDLLTTAGFGLDGSGARCYGRCYQCGQQIATERLHALPCATLCLPCEQQQD